MKRVYFLLTTLDDISISESHAKSFANKCLDFIPGSATMGAFAQFGLRNGEDLNSNRWFNLLQNNQTCFSNCLPVELDNETSSYIRLALPVPSSLHYAKLYQKTIKDYVNACADFEDNDQQLKQEREGYILGYSPNENSTLQKLVVKTNSVTKTSINHESQTAAEGKLFSMSLIRKNQRFMGYIQVSEEDVELVKDFVNSKSLRIGKSRNNEFGRVSISIIENMPNNGVLHTSFAELKDNNLLYLWCLSDCEFYDFQLCQPTTLPRFDNLWLDNNFDATYLPEKSFIRTKKVRLFNRKRGGLDGEKQLISKGSIICFKLSKPLSKNQLQDIEFNSIGLDRQLGFGRVIVNPTWISNYKLNSKINFFDLTDIDIETFNSASSGNISNHRLYDWLKSKSCESIQETKYSQNAKEILKEIKNIYLTSRKYNTIKDCDTWGKRNTQWNKRKEIISRYHLDFSQKFKDNIVVRKKKKKYFDDRKDREIQMESWAAKCNANTIISDLVQPVFDKYKNGELIAFFDIVDDADLSDNKNIQQN